MIRNRKAGSCLLSSINLIQNIKLFMVCRNTPQVLYLLDGARIYDFICFIGGWGVKVY